MISAARGRVLMWRGGSLWIGWPADPTSVHSHHAVQVTVALDAGVVRFRTDGGWRDYRATLVPAHLPHAFEARGRFIAHVFAEPESHLGRRLLQRCTGGRIESLCDEQVQVFRRRLDDAYASAEREPLQLAARGLLEALAADKPSIRALDPRVERAIEVVRGRLDEAVRLREAAQAAHLSPERFRRLFQEQTGIRFRPYVLWLRLEKAVEALAAGKSLTACAAEAGFADSAHLSRTFRRMFGVAPASLKPE